MTSNGCVWLFQRFAAVIMRIREPRTTALIFSSGKMVCTGAKRWVWGARPPGLHRVKRLMHSSRVVFLALGRNLRRAAPLLICMHLTRVLCVFDNM